MTDEIKEGQNGFEEEDDIWDSDESIELEIYRSEKRLE